MLIQFIQKASDFVVRHKKVFSLLLLPITGVSILFGLLLIAPIFMVGRTLGLKMAYAPTDASQTVARLVFNETRKQCNQVLWSRVS